MWSNVFLNWLISCGKDSLNSETQQNSRRENTFTPDCTLGRPTQSGYVSGYAYGYHCDWGVACEDPIGYEIELSWFWRALYPESNFEDSCKCRYIVFFAIPVKQVVDLVLLANEWKVEQERAGIFMKQQLGDALRGHRKFACSTQKPQLLITIQH